MVEPIKHFVRKLLRQFGYELRRYQAPRDSVQTLLDQKNNEKPIEIIFDVGANEGQSAQQFREWFPQAKLYSFEPYATVFAKLRQNSELDPQWYAEPLALGTETTELGFHVNQVSGANSILATDKASDAYFPDNPHRTLEQTKISVDRLDRYCAVHAIESIDFLNIDTQGYDYQVLAGAGALLCPENIRVVLTEVLFIPLYEQQARFEQILQLMTTRGYKFYGLIGGHSDIKQGLYWSNALFVAP